MPSIIRFSSASRLLRHSAFALLASSALQPIAALAEEGDDIVVTALRRDTTVQKTPLAITAISADSLANIGATNFTDDEKLAPGLRLQDSGPGQRRISLRGILAAGEPTVGGYYDEAPVAVNLGIGSDTHARLLAVRRRADRSFAWPAGDAVRRQFDGWRGAHPVRQA